MITSPGFYDMPAEEYHADPCPEPSLSGSIAIPLIHRSPRHAWFAHPRLNPNAEREDSARLDLGSAAHAILLGKGMDIAVIAASDWRKQAVQEERDAARQAGKIPMLTKTFEQASAMAEAARKVIQFPSGDAEIVMAWKEEAVWCRGMMDWLSLDCRLVVDYKTTSASARPDDAERSLYDLNYHLKAAFYERGLDVLNPGNIGRRAFLFLFQETDPPYECSLIAPSEGGMTIGRKQATYAIRRWQQCMADGIWPGYGSETHVAAVPPWIERRWLEREINDPFATGETAPGGRIEPYVEKPAMEWTP